METVVQASIFNRVVKESLTKMILEQGPVKEVQECTTWISGGHRGPERAKSE